MYTYQVPYFFTPFYTYIGLPLGMSQVVETRGRKQVYTDEEIIGALEETHGLLYQAAKRLGCSPQTIFDRCKTSPEVGNCRKFQRGEFIDLSEQRLYESVDSGNTSDAKFVLQTIGRHRGWVQVKEHRHGGTKDGIPIRTEHSTSFTITMEVLQRLTPEVQEQLLNAIQAVENEQQISAKRKEITENGDDSPETPGTD